MRFSTNSILVLTFALALGVVGCGDDDGGGSGGTAGGGTGGGGSGGTGGGGTGGTGGTPNMCGTTTCEAPPAGLGFPGTPMAAHCCTDDDDLCGISSDGLLNAGTCLEQNAAGNNTDQCPTETLDFANPLDATMTFPIPLTGCCRPDNTCGLSSLLTIPLVNIELDLGTGCTERTLLSSSLADGPSPAWAAVACDYAATNMDGGTESDAGN